jgi:Siphovirus Gp157
MRFLELQADNCDVEVRRLQERKKRYQNALQRVRGYVQYVLESMGQDDKGKWRKLEGNTVTFSLRNQPPRLEIWDETQIPWEYQDITVTLPVSMWQDLTAGGLPSIEAKAKYCPNKQRIKEAIDRCEEIPGADLQVGFGLVVR